MDLIITAVQSLNQYIFVAAFIFIALDVVTGYLQAVANKNVQSNIMRKGFWHKLAIIFALICAGVLDVTASVEASVTTGIGIDAPIFDAACVFVIWMELMSVLENIKKMNPQLANSKLMQLFGDADKEIENDDNQ